MLVHFRTQPDEIVNICFSRPKKQHLDCDEISEQEECLKTDSISNNIEPTESDKEEFFKDLAKVMPTSATLTTVDKNQKNLLVPNLSSGYQQHYKLCMTQNTKNYQNLILGRPVNQHFRIYL